MPGERTFIGPLNRRQQQLLDEREAREDIKGFVPERCSSCMHLNLLVVGRFATQVALGEATTLEAAQGLVRYTEGCTGPVVNRAFHDAADKCPKKDEEDSQYRTHCW